MERLAARTDAVENLPVKPENKTPFNSQWVGAQFGFCLLTYTHAPWGVRVDGCRFLF